MEESLEMSDMDKRVAVVEVEQNVTEDRDEERVGFGEGNLPVEGERRILIAGSSHAAGLYPYFNPGYEVDTLSFPGGLVGDIRQGLEEVNLLQYAAVVIIVGGNDIFRKDGTFRCPLRFLIDDLTALKSYVVTKTMFHPTTSGTNIQINACRCILSIVDISNVPVI